MTRQVVMAGAGGQVSAANGRFKVQIPQDALKQDVAITIQQIDTPLGGAIGPVYDVGPTGTLFQRPVTLSFSFANVQLGGADPTTLHVATLSGGKWIPVTSAVDLVSSVVTGQITHLSPWTLIVYTSAVIPPEPDAGTGGAGGGAGTSGAAGGGGAGTTGTAGGGGAGTTGMAGGGGAGTTGTAGGGGAGTTGMAGDGGGGAGGQGGAAGASGQAGSGGGGGQGGAGGQDVDAASDAHDGGADAPTDVDPDAA